jgi:hypothetical protein
MAKVANRVQGREGAILRKASMPPTVKVLETKVSIAKGFQDLRDMNRQALINLKN